MALRISLLRYLPKGNLQKRHTHDGFAALNIYKDASKAPREQEDKEYPEWLWRLKDPLPTQQELLREADALYESGGYDAVFEGMKEDRLKRLFRMAAKERIKENNDRRRGGKVI